MNLNQTTSSTASQYKLNKSKLSDQELHLRLLEAVKEEKNLLTRVLHLLKEVDSRKLFSDFKCASLFEYATKILQYSEAEAYVRINAMRLIRELPQIEEHIKSGELSLTNIAQAHTYFKKEERQKLKKSNSHKKSSAKLKAEEKIEVLSQLKNCSTRQAQKVLSRLSPELHIHSESIKTLDSEKVELKVNLTHETLNKLQKIKGLLTSEKGVMSYSELINTLCDKTLKNLETKSNSTSESSAYLSTHTNTDKINKTITPKMKSSIKQWDQFKCVNCKSIFDLQIDHIHPQGLGGNNHPNNLQTLCRSCNLRRAIKTYGAHKCVSN